MKHIGRVKVVIEANDTMDTFVICPRCGRHTIYGELVMYCGSHGCPSCYSSMRAEIENDRTNHYSTYVKKSNNHDYEPYKYVEVE